MRVTIGSVLAETWAVARANVRAILVWAAIHLAVGLAMRVAMAPMMAARASGDPGTLVSFGGHFALFAIAWLAMMALLVVLYAAVSRMVLFPGERRFAYLRLGRDELRLLGLIVVLGLGLMLVWMIGLQLVMLVAAGIAAAAGASKAALGGIAFVLAFAIWLGLLFVTVRLSLAGSLTIARGRISIGRAWRLTRRRFWMMFGLLLIVWIGVAAITILIALPQLAAVWPALAHPGDPAMTQRLLAIQAEQASLRFTPGALLQVIGGAIGGAATVMFVGAVPAVATRQLLAARADDPAAPLYPGPWAPPPMEIEHDEARTRAAPGRSRRAQHRQLDRDRRGGRHWFGGDRGRLALRHAPEEAARSEMKRCGRTVSA